jgi:hypothetical protein
VNRLSIIYSRNLTKESPVVSSSPLLIFLDASRDDLESVGDSI